MKTVINNMLCAAAVALTITSCSSGFSESKALSVAKETPGFAEALYSPIKTNASVISVNGSDYVINGTSVEHREKTDEAIHTLFKGGDLPVFSLNSKDDDGNVICLVGYYYGRYSGFCGACQYCLERFKDKGLLTYKLTESPSPEGLCRAEIKLTPEGEKYIVKSDNRNNLLMAACESMNANSGSADIIKLATKVYTGATKIYEDENEAEFYLQYYLDMTPFGEALYGETMKEPSYQTLVTYRKDGEGKWHVKSRKDLRRNAKTVDF